MTDAGVAALRVECELVSAAVGVDASTVISRVAGRFAAVAESLGGSADGGDDFASLSARTLGLLDRAQAPVSGDLLRSIGDAGSHPTHLWADGLVHTCLVARVFDLGGEPVTSSVVPAIDWLVSSLPQASVGLLDVLTAPVAIHIGPPCDRTITLWHVGDGVGVGESSESATAAAAHVTIDPVDLLRCCAGRSRWSDEDTSITGDRDLAAAVLDRLATA